MQAEAQLFKVLADPTRLKLAILLAVRGQMCVCELVHALDEPQYKISRHLAVMRAENIVQARRQGTWMHYRLAEPANELEKCLFDCFRDCLKAQTPIQNALNRLKEDQCATPNAG